MQVPIEIDEDTDEILDGYHRYKACLELGIEPPITRRQFNSEPDRAWHAVALNIYRRQLAKSQIAALLVKYRLPIEEAKAKERKMEGLKKGQEFPVSAKVHSRAHDRGKATAKVAKEAGVSPRYVAQAKALKKNAPQVFNEVIEGKKTLPQASRELSSKKNDKTKAPASTRNLQTQVDRALKDIIGQVQKCLSSFPVEWKSLFIKKLTAKLTTLASRFVTMNN